MGQRRDKDMAWTLICTAFLFLLVSAVTGAAVNATVGGVPEPISLSRVHLGRSFVGATAGFVKYVSIAGILYGIAGIFTWPPGAGD